MPVRARSLQRRAIRVSANVTNPIGFRNGKIPALRRRSGLRGNPNTGPRSAAPIFHAEKQRLNRAQDATEVVEANGEGKKLAVNLSSRHTCGGCVRFTHLPTTTHSLFVSSRT